MKFMALCVAAFGACTAVSASEKNDTQSAVENLLQGGAQIDWNMYSPSALGMNLNYDEMSQEQLQEVARAFASLGLIGAEEIEEFVQALQDPRMRRMMKNVTERWPETMTKVMSDPKYQAFLQEFQGGFSEDTLAKIVGLKDGLAGAARQIEEAEAERDGKH